MEAMSAAFRSVVSPAMTPAVLIFASDRVAIQRFLRAGKVMKLRRAYSEMQIPSSVQ